MFNQLPFLITAVVIALLYISNVHLAEKKMRSVQDLKQEVKELRWEFVSLHSQMMQNTTQSHTASKVEKLGLKWGESRPIVIVDEK